METENGVVVLKAAKSSNAKSLGSAITNEIIKNRNIQVRAIGVQAVNQAVKGQAIAGGFLGQQGYLLTCVTGFANVNVASKNNGESITAIVFNLSIDRR